MDFTLADFTIDTYDAVYALWEKCTGIALSRADSRSNIRRYLERNPGLSFVAKCGEDIAGAVLAGHDGRRGYIHHLAVDKDQRRKGIGRGLVEKSLTALRGEGIQKCHLFIFRTNQEGLRFWKAMGWQFRPELGIISTEITPAQ